VPAGTTTIELHVGVFKADGGLVATVASGPAYQDASLSNSTFSTFRRYVLTVRTPAATTVSLRWTATRTHVSSGFVIMQAVTLR
jgi:hypothetical protein